MLIIKKEQMEIFKTLLTQEFENKMLHHLSSVFPEQTIDLTEYGYGDGETYWKPLWKAARPDSGVSEEWRKELSRKIMAALDTWETIYRDTQTVGYDVNVIIACLADIKSPNRKRAVDLIMKEKAYPAHYNGRFPINFIKDYVTDEEMRLLSKKFFDEIGVKKPGDKKPDKLDFFKRLWSEIKKHKKLHGY